MLVNSNFSPYERPEGYETGHTQVLVRSSAIEESGLPEVDYDNLSRLCLDTPRPLDTIKLYSRKERWVVTPFGPPPRLWQLPSTNTLHVNTFQADTWPNLPDVAQKNGTMAAIVGHIAIRENTKATTLKYRVGAELAFPSGMIGVAMAGVAQEAMVAATIGYQALVRTDKRVLELGELKKTIERSAVSSSVYEQHAQDIRFPSKH